MYAILQDFIRPNLLLHLDTESLRPLSTLNPNFNGFEEVYRIPGGQRERVVLFPIHIAVPIVFDTYRRRPNVERMEGPDSAGEGIKPQTDKGFRGAFLEFLSCDDTGFLDDHLLRVVRHLFARVEGLTALDLALVQSLSNVIVERRGEQVQRALGRDALTRLTRNDPGFWEETYAPMPEAGPFRPLAQFAQQGRRLHEDVQAIAHTAGLSRIERIAMVERLIAYHLAIYLVRVTRCLYKELEWAHQNLHGDSLPRAQNPWHNGAIHLRFHSQTKKVTDEVHSSYRSSMDQINEAYLLLPVLNNIEIAVRCLNGKAGGEPARIDRLQWAEARVYLSHFGEEQRALTREVLAFLAEMGNRHVDASPPQADRLRHTPAIVLFDAIRTHYSDPAEQRYPRDHHQIVFEQVASSGPTSFIQRLPRKHFTLGDELLYLLVLAMFEHRDPEDRDDSTYAIRDRGKLRRHRLPLTKFEARLEQDLLLPADEGARQGLRNSLARLGLLDRFSDVGEANFLRHPTGI
jgi:hypothetical protein